MPFKCFNKLGNKANFSLAKSYEKWVSSKKVT